MSVYPQTTGYVNWHIADTGNGKGVRLCCFDEVAWVENAFCKHGIRLYLVFGVGEDAFGEVPIKHEDDICARRAWRMNALKASTYTLSLPDGRR